MKVEVWNKTHGIVELYELTQAPEGDRSRVGVIWVSLGVVDVKVAEEFVRYLQRAIREAKKINNEVTQDDTKNERSWNC